MLPTSICSVMFCSLVVLVPRVGYTMDVHYFLCLGLSLSSIILIDSVHVLMLYIQAVRGLPRLCAQVSAVANWPAPRNCAVDRAWRLLWYSGRESELGGIVNLADRWRSSFYRAMLCIRGTSHGSVSVRLSVCPSQVGVLLKRLNLGSHKQHHTIAQGL